jgi:hypothetical protein
MTSDLKCIAEEDVRTEDRCVPSDFGDENHVANWSLRGAVEDDGKEFVLRMLD